MLRATPAVTIVLAGALVVACSDRSGGDKVLARAGRDAHLLGAFKGRVYWGRGATVRWIDDGLAEPQSIDAAGADWASRDNFAMDDGGVYFSHHNKLTYLALDRGGSGGWMDPAGDHPTGVALDDQCVYTLDVDVEDGGRGAIIALPKFQGASCSGREAPANGRQPVPFRMDAEHFYWVDTGSRRVQQAAGIKALPRGSGPAVLIAQEDARDLQVGEQGVYWRTRTAIRFAARSPFRAPSTLVDGEIQDLLVHRGGVFYVTGDGVHGLKEGTRQPRRIVNNAGVRELVADDRFLYWLTSGGEIARTRRPD